MSESPALDFAIQLVTAIIGAFSGAYFGLRFARGWDRKKKREEEVETKNRILDAIILELQTVQKEILMPSLPKIEWIEAQKYFTGRRISIPTTALQSAVNSGNFSLFSSSLQKELGWVYRRMDKCQTYNDEIGNFYATPIFTFSNDPKIVNREATRLVSKFNVHVFELDKEIKEILPKLESAKTDSQNTSKKEMINNELE